MQKLFINLTNHKLLEKQVEEAKKLADKIIEKEDIFDEDIAKKLQQSPSELEELKTLAKKVAGRIEELKKENEKIYVHLPIGSPLFQALLFNELLKTNVTLIYSHSKRIVEEKDDKKISKFEFQKFIIIEPNDLEEQ